MVSLDQVFEFLALLPPHLLLGGLVGTASLIALLAEWRLSLLALLSQYVLAGLLLARAVFPQVAAIRILIGGLVCSVLYLTARYTSPQSEAFGFRALDLGRWTWDLFFRLFALALVGVGVYGLHAGLPFPEVPRDLGLGAYWLAAMGLLIMALAEGPFQMGLGLLTFESGFEALYATLESGLTVAGLMGIVNLLIALAVAYLAVGREGGIL
ncbi:MAG: hypothetical protein ACE5MB_07890 [Anaerolineae bacterium]